MGTVSSLVFWVLDVGQGTGNFLQTFDDHDNLVGSALIDLGSSRERQTAGFKSVEKVVELLGGEDHPATLDLLLLSHSDIDHVVLVPEVLRCYSPDGKERPKLTIKEMAYGGEYVRYSKYAGNVVAKARQFMPRREPAELAPCYSAFGTTKPPKPNFTVGDTRYYLLMANAAEAEEPPTKRRRVTARASDGYNVNTNSLVVLVEHGDLQFVVTGDATGQTLYQINEVLRRKRHHLTNVRMLTLPHHGSATTTFNVHGADVTPEDNLRTFATNLSPRSVTGSADKVATYKHPSAKVMSYFWESVANGGYWQDPLLGEKRHFYTAYFLPGDGFTSGGAAWPAGADWYSVQSAYGLYTNMYVDQGGGSAQAIVLPPDKSKRQQVARANEPPIGVAWKYTVSGRALTLDREINRDDFERLVARLGWVPEEWPDAATLGDARFVTLPSARGAPRRTTPAPPAPATPAPEPVRTAPTTARPLPRVRELP